MANNYFLIFKVVFRNYEKKLFPKQVQDDLNEKKVICNIYIRYPVYRGLFGIREEVVRN